MTLFTKSELKALANLGLSESRMQQALLEEQNQPTERVSTPEGLRALGLDTEGEMVISVGQPRRKSCP